jgi:hypothetical protein
MANNVASNRLSKNWHLFGYVYLSTLVPMLLCIIACTAATTLPTTPEPICQAHAMPTAEKYIPPTLEAPHPTQVYPEQLVTIDFSGGYLFLNYGIDCFDERDNGKNDYVGYAHADELAWSEHSRTTRVKLWASDERCEIEFVVPPDEPYYTVVCGGGDVVGYVLQDDLPRFAYRRAIEVYFDEDLLTSTECKNECGVEFTIPPDASPGTHKLKITPGLIYVEGTEKGTPVFLLPTAALQGLEFDIEVVEESTTP